MAKFKRSLLIYNFLAAVGLSGSGLVFGGRNKKNENEYPWEVYKGKNFRSTIHTQAKLRRCLAEDDPLGLNYNGPVRKTTDGKRCAGWKFALHRDNSKLDATKIIGGVRHNRCRNPDEDTGGPWCFLKNYDKTVPNPINWGHCDIQHCEIEDTEATCYEGDGQDYRGTVSTTVSGRKCRAWDRKKPHQMTKNQATSIVKRGVNHNDCRMHPDITPDFEGSIQPIGPWCFTTERGTRWEYCDIEKCPQVVTTVEPLLQARKLEEPTEVVTVGPTEVVPTCGLRKSYKKTRIVNGVQAKPNEFPWQIHMRFGNNTPIWKRGTGFCGGSILNAVWIITAAHCMIENGVYFEDAENIGIAVGWHDDVGLYSDISDDDRKLGTNFITAKNLTAHPDYDSVNIFYDIALIELSKSIEWGKSEGPDIFSDTNVRPICLPSPSSEESIESEQIHNIPKKSSPKCIVSGWGDTEFDPDVDANKLVYGEVPLVSAKKCDSMLGAGNLAPNNTNICAFDAGNHVDSCGGDSGGPLACYFANSYASKTQQDSGHKDKQLVDRYVLLGVTSWGFSCGKEYPGVYTRVSKFMPWILEITKAEDLQIV